MKCPVCNISMDVIELGGIELDFCRNGCKGLWFDNFELRQVMSLDEQENRLLDSFLEQKRVDDTDRAEPLNCPRCDDSKLRRHKFSGVSDVFIDQCYICNGIWLDAGELRAINDSMKDAPDEDQAVKTLLASNPALGARFIHRETKGKLTAIQLDIQDRHLAEIKSASTLGSIYEAFLRLIFRLLFIR